MGTDGVLSMCIYIYISTVIGGYAIREGRQTGIRKPGEFFFDPLRLGKPSIIKRYEENEVQNGRLAMIGE